MASAARHNPSHSSNRSADPLANVPGIPDLLTCATHAGADTVPPWRTPTCTAGLTLTGRWEASSGSESGPLMKNTAPVKTEPRGWPLETSFPIDLAPEAPWFLLREVWKPLTCRLPASPCLLHRRPEEIQKLMNLAKRQLLLVLSFAR